MPTVETKGSSGSLLASLLAEENFRPSEPRSIEETGLSPSYIENLAAKYLFAIGSATGRQIAETLCLPFGILGELFHSLRARQIVVHCGSAALNDYVYTLTEQGRSLAHNAMKACSYFGTAPVPLNDYVTSVEAQTIRAEAPRREQLVKAFEGLWVEPDLFDQLGPAVNSGAGLFLYGTPGNGKTTLATRITACFGQDIWIPRVIIEDGQLVKLFDAACHTPVDAAEGTILRAGEHDRRWMKIRRPTVVVGGELMMESLEIKHDFHSNVGEASLQMKSNCGTLLIDDFGRQRIDPTQLLNRWIVPLESRHDFLSLANGKKIQVPFEQLIIFSTNLEPSDLADDAFLRRIPYKIEVGDPSEPEFHKLFEIFCRSFKCPYRKEMIDYLIDRHYRTSRRPLRRCQPRDLLLQIRNYCNYKGLPVELKPEYFDLAVKTYFTVMKGT